MDRLRYWIGNILSGRSQCISCCMFCRFYRQCRTDALPSGTAGSERRQEDTDGFI